MPSDVHVARRLAELVDDCEFCREGEDHEVCLLSPRVACWPEPHPMHDMDDPEWRVW